MLLLTHLEYVMLEVLVMLRVPVAQGILEMD